jgi:hypothetical protein
VGQGNQGGKHQDAVRSLPSMASSISLVPPIDGTSLRCAVFSRPATGTGHFSSPDRRRQVLPRERPAEARGHGFGLGPQPVASLSSTREINSVLRADEALQVAHGCRSPLLIKGEIQSCEHSSSLPLSFWA